MKKQYITPDLSVVLLQSESIMVLSGNAGSANSSEPKFDYLSILDGMYN